MLVRTDQVDTMEPQPKRRFKMTVSTALIALLGLGGLGVGLYPMTASWVSSYNQSLVVKQAVVAEKSAIPTAAEQISEAHTYNDALRAGIELEAGGNVPASSGFVSAGAGFTYEDMLHAGTDTPMSRIKIDGIEADLPVFHGTSQATLLKGAGHLEGSHLPVGGIGTRTVITAHRGLASSTMFTNLDQVKVGDRFVLETFGEVLTYQVRTIDVIDPEDTDTLLPDPGRDLATLITCTPLGINTQRIVVTGERVTPTPIADIEAAGASPSVPGFPWWAVWGLAGLIIITIYTVRQGRADARSAHRALLRVTESTNSGEISNE